MSFINIATDKHRLTNITRTRQLTIAVSHC
jgi:hypothetical protein